MKELTVSGDRTSIRHQLVHTFLQEPPGTGTGENCSVHRYKVEALPDGRTVYLKRPARLNKGFDFEVNVSETNFGTSRRTSMPSHSSIYDDLSQKMQEDPKQFQAVAQLIHRIYRCEPVTDQEMRQLRFTSGHPIELILKSIKWLFIEQDLTYWNWSGRQMLYSGLQDLIGDSQA
jgi:hypothetical protein